MSLYVHHCLSLLASDIRTWGCECVGARAWWHLMREFPMRVTHANCDLNCSILFISRRMCLSNTYSYNSSWRHPEYFPNDLQVRELKVRRSELVVKCGTVLLQSKRLSAEECMYPLSPRVEVCGEIILFRFQSWDRGDKQFGFGAVLLLLGKPQQAPWALLRYHTTAGTPLVFQGIENLRAARF